MQITLNLPQDVAEGLAVKWADLPRAALESLALYGRVIVPAGVARELTAGGSPSVVRTWAGAAPGWVEIRRVDVPADAGLDAVDEREAEAIVLAEGLPVSRTLPDLAKDVARLFG